MKSSIKDNDQVEERYGSWLKQCIDMIAPKNLYLIMGRGGAKSTDILAERSMDLCYDMPGAYIAITVDTFLNGLKTIVPGILEGWERKGWREGIHYVKDSKPPAHFGKPYKPLLSYKHTIITFHGTVFKLISQDRPSIGAGESFQHLIGDEGKHLVKKKLDKLFPAIRGGDYVRFGKSPYYRGHTFTSDRANPMQGEDDWMETMAQYMDPEQIKLILQCAQVLNEIRLEIIQLEREGKDTGIAEKNLNRWLDRYNRIRKDSTLYLEASSMVNVDILSLDYFKDSLKALGPEEYNTAVLSTAAAAPKAQMFYPLLKRVKRYKDGYNYDHYDQFSLGNKILETSAGLKYVDPDRRLEAGFDAGNMMSLVFSQYHHDKRKLYLLKNMHTFVPDWLEQLGANFAEFWKDHNFKELDLWYDRSANNFSRAKKDFASQLKENIEMVNGVRTGWRVNLMSRNQGNITHDQEYDLCMQLFSGENPNLPEVLMDAHECKILYSSMQNAKGLITKDAAGKTTFKKDKSSEKEYKDDERKLVWYSTNYSDAFKYLVCRPEFLKIASRKKSNASFVDPKVY